MVKRFILQWHLSENCNLKCLHCYQENKKAKNLSYEQLKIIFEQYKELLKKLHMDGHINITGGEPLCNPHLFAILDLINKEDNITFCLLTNGTLITKEIAEKIQKYHPTYVQVSLEGGKKTNDCIRGKNTYKQIAKGIKNLKSVGIKTSISFTATKINYQEFPKVVKFALKNKVDNLWSDRYIPLGDSIDKQLAMNYEETRKYFAIMNFWRQKTKNTDLTISMNRALQFQMTNDFAYGCTAGISLLTVMENGDLVPCRRMPIVVGNLFTNKMYDLYQKSKVLKELRKNNIPDECQHCEHSKTCRGGLKCLTYALYHDLNYRDVGCNT